MHSYAQATNTPSLFRSVGICVAFCLLSSLSVLLNKHVMSGVLPSGSCLLFVQSVATLLLLHAGKRLQWFQISVCFDVTTWVTAVLYTGNVLTGLGSLKFLSVAMFSTLKRCNVIVSWVLEVISARKETTMQAIGPILLIVAGTFLASHNDLQYSKLGYLLAAASCLCQSSSFELGRRVALAKKAPPSATPTREEEKKSDATPTENIVVLLYVNSITSIALVGALILFSGEWALLLPWRFSVSDISQLMLNCVVTLLMNYTIFLNCTVNSPLAHTVTGNFKAALTTVAAIGIYGTTTHTIIGWGGVLTNFIGAVWFSIQRLSHHRARKKEKQCDDNAKCGGTVLV